MKKKNSVKILTGSLAAFLFVAASSDLSALSLNTESELSFSGGWRQDHYRSFVTDNLDSDTDLVKGSNLNIWQLGVQGWVSPDFGSCDTFFNNFFARGSAYWGWVNSGVYLHKVVTVVPGAPTTNTIDRGDISRGHTWDYNVGGGYLFDLGCNFKAGPTGGYSYNKLTFKGENIVGVIDTVNTSTALDTLAYFDEGVLISSKWQGPWAGADLFWESCGWSIYASYEYHWLRQNGSYISSSTNLTDDSHFSDVITGRKGYGHTGYFGTHYFAGNVIAGFGVKYNYFRIKGHLRPTVSGGFPAVGGSASEVDHVKDMWNSVSVYADLGYTF